MGLNFNHFWKAYFIFIIILFIVTLSYFVYYVSNLKNCLCREVDKMQWTYVITGSDLDCVSICEANGLIAQYEAGNLSDIIPK